jgi:hypothetical protein
MNTVRLDGARELLLDGSDDQHITFERIGNPHERIF